MSNYLVLARKYRPQTFAEIVGQEHVTRTLANAIAAGRVHHAFVFTGARGVGKTTAARILAKALCCEKGPTATPCGQCEPCTEIRAGNSVDVIEIDGASNRGIDDVRGLRETVRYQPAKYRKKIVIVDEVHMLTTEAFNALLKTLEEPPPHIAFVFATTEPHKIPVTILSRCQRYDFKLIPTTRLAAFLGEILGQEKIAADAEALAVIAREAAGSARDALSLCDQVVAFCGPGEPITRDKVIEALGIADRRALFEVTDAILARDAEAALRSLDGAHMAGQDLGQFARALLAHLRDLAIVTSVKDPTGLVDAPETELDALRAQAKQTDPQMAQALFDRFTHAAGEILESQFPKMLIELALLDLVRAEPVVPIADLLERLAELEKGAPMTPVAQSKVPAPKSPTPKAQAAGPAPQTQTPTETRTRTETPTPTAPQPPAPQPLSPSAPQPHSWEAFLQLVEEKSVGAYGVLALANPVAFGKDGVVLAFAPGELGLAEMRKAEIEDLVGATFGGKTPVTLRAADTAGASAAPSLDESNRKRADEERDRRRSEARQHPSTKATLDVFGGAEIKDIKVDFD